MKRVLISKLVSVSIVPSEGRSLFFVRLRQFMIRSARLSALYLHTSSKYCRKKLREGNLDDMEDPHVDVKLPAASDGVF